MRVAIIAGTGQPKPISMERPRVLIPYKYSDTQFRTSGSNFFGQFWCEAAGAVSVASAFNGMADINLEQVYEWESGYHLHNQLS